MRGSQTPPEKVEEVKAIAAKTANLLETSRITGVPEATVHGIVKSDDKFEEFREQAQKDYIISTWNNIKAISNALAEYIADGKLKRAGLTEFTRALRDLESTVKNVVNNLTIIGQQNNTQNNYEKASDEQRYEYMKKWIEEYEKKWLITKSNGHTTTDR